ncbi:hypothetical protein NFI96_027743 [Prochilodus magdalenae]|nr:hypothetical protein NFI96_027743 [Prochilodus magdalenae]
MKLNMFMLLHSLLGAYNSLTDKHLTCYFNNTRIRRHLQKVGLLSRSGRIIPEKEYRHKLIQRAHQRHIRECLAQAIFHKVLDMERLHQIEIKRKLEEFARRERVHKIKVERTNRYEEDPIMMLSPRPPTGPKNSHTRHSGPEVEHSESTESPGSSRPNTAPGKMQRPVRLKPLNSTSTPGSLKRNSSRYRYQDSSNETDHPFSSPLERDATRHLTLTDFSSTVSPYRLPVINNFVTPVPPLTKKKEKGTKGNGTLRSRRLRPTTAPSAADTQEGAVQRASLQNAVTVKMVYFGKSVHLSHDLMDLKDEVKVFQQHCGGENLCVYKGRLKEGEMFQFVSRRHRGFPFSLTFFLNGLQVERLSSCCEFKHRKGSRLGGRHGHFGFTGVEGASPCYRCIIAMGLDKKPTPPKRAKDDPLLSTSRENSKEEEDEERKTDLSQTHKKDTKGDTTQEENKLKNEYEEDFEADDEGPVEDAADETSPSPLKEEEEEGGKKDENENDVMEKNQDSDSEAGDSGRNKVKRSSSVSSGLPSSSSSNTEDESEGQEPGDEEEVPEETVEPKRCDSTLTSEKDTKMEETEVMDTSSVSLPQQMEEESETQDSFIEKSDMEISEDTDRVDGEGEKLRQEVDEDQVKNEDKEKGVEPEKAKSVQEKLAEAILNMPECSSEPELSDTTTEEDEVSSIKTQQDSPGAEPETSAPEQLYGEHEEISNENAAEPSPEAKPVEGDEDIQQAAEKETNETPQPESKTEEKERNAENTDEKYEPSVGEKQNDLVVTSVQTDDTNLEDVENVEEDKASEEPNIAGKPDIEKIAEGKETKEPETEVENMANAEESGCTPVEKPELAQTGEKLEPRDVITEPQFEDPGEKAAAVDTESVGEVDNNACQDAELESQEQTDTAENGGTGEEASAEDKVKEEVGGDEEEAGCEVDGEEKEGSDEMRGETIAKEGDKANGESMVEDEVEEKDEKEIIRDNMQQEISEEAEAREPSLEISEAEGNMLQKKQVEDEGEKVNDLPNTDEEKQAEFTLEKNAEVADSGEDSKERDDDKQEEAVMEPESVKEDEGGEKTEIESVEKAEDNDRCGETEPAVDQDTVSKSDSKPEAGVKENESVTEGEAEDEEQMVIETESQDQSRDITDDVESSAVNIDNTSMPVEQNVDVSPDESREEKTDDGGGGDDGEVKEGLNSTNMEDQDLEEVDEEMSENSTNHESAEENPASEGILEVSETENKPDEKEVEDNIEQSEDTIIERDPESAIDKAAELEGENQTDNGVENVKPEEEVKDDESAKEKETEGEGHTEEEQEEEEGGGGEDMDGKEDKKGSVEVGRDHAELQEGTENDKMEQKEDAEPAINDGLQEATISNEEKSDETDTQNGEEAIIADGEIEKEEETPARLEKYEATFDVGKEEMIQAKIEQDTTNEEDKEKQEDEKEKEAEKASSNADDEVPLDAKSAAEESEMKGEDTDLENKVSIGGEDKHAGSPAFEEGKQAGAEGASADGEGSTSSASPSEESQPAEKVMALKREDRESAFTEDAELLASPPADQGDLVSNWVNIHQASRYFETFVEPLDDLKSLIAHKGEGKVDGEAEEEPEETTLSTKDTESGGADKRSDTAKEEQVKSDLEDMEDALVESFNTETKPEALESDAKSSQSKDATPRSDKNVLEDRDDTEAKDLVPDTESMFTSGELLAIPVDNLPETPVMKFEISQDS